MPIHATYRQSPTTAARHLLGAPSGAARCAFTRATHHTRVCHWTWNDRSVIEKIHRDPARAAREQEALTAHGPASLLGASPTLLATTTDPNGLIVLVLEHLPPSSNPMNLDAALAAGTWLARLHALPVQTPDPLPLAVALGRRWSGLRKRARRLVDPHLLQPFIEAVEPIESLATGPRVFCHRDYTPDNWMWSAPSTPPASPHKLWVLDFEHSRLDAAMADLVKLEAEVFPQHPSLRAPFYDGYGAPPVESERRAWCVWHALGTWVWGLRHGERSFAELGDAMLASQGFDMEALREIALQRLLDSERASNR